MRSAKPAVAVAIALLSCVSALAWAATSSVTLSPSYQRTIAKPRLRLGPFGVRNGTSDRYRVSALPDLLGQHRDGSLFVRLDAASLARARRLLSTSAPTPSLPPRGVAHARA